MCRFLAYAGAPVFLDSLLVRPNGLIAQSLAARQARTVVNGDGCGVGWYAERPEPGLYRGILPAWSDANLASLCRQIRSGLFFAHVRAATSGEVSAGNCHPFAVGRNLFMHNGQIGAYAGAAVRRGLEAMIPDALYPHRRGTTDSEAIFLAALGRGLETDPAAAFAATLREILALHDPSVLADYPVRFAAVHSDGEAVHAFRWSSDEAPPSLWLAATADEAGLVIASEPCDEAGLEWTAVPPSAVLSLKPGRGALLSAFDVALPARGARRAA